ncbi:MAG: 2-nitropropane dioxygenase, partial [Pseudonocardia sp.]|nr:2-nitropropane dioxygenase [Pseudonocardia sp.]
MTLTDHAPTVRVDPAGMYDVLARLDQPCYVVRTEGRVGLSHSPPDGDGLVAVVAPLPP